MLDPAAPQRVFTGDVLLIRGTGRTDFQNGDPRKSWDSIVHKLFRLPDETLVYLSHDYKGWTVSSIGEEKRYNLRLAGNTVERYVEIMRNLKLPNPAQMDIAVPANLACGQLGKAWPAFLTALLLRLSRRRPGAACSRRPTRHSVDYAFAVLWSAPPRHDAS